MTRIKAPITAMATITAKATSQGAPCRVMDWTELRPWHLDILSQSHLALQCTVDIVDIVDILHLDIFSQFHLYAAMHSLILFSMFNAKSPKYIVTVLLFSPMYKHT